MEANSGMRKLFLTDSEFDAQGEIEWLKERMTKVWRTEWGWIYYVVNFHEIT